MRCSPSSSQSRLARRFLLAAWLIAALAPTARAQTDSNAPAPRRPCIILIVADDLGCGDLGCYGQTKIKTPNIDKLAAGGMRFTSFYAGSSLSAPARVALLTGKHTGHSTLRGSAPLLAQKLDVTIATTLKAAKYSTLAAGEWALGDTVPPGRYGFDEWFGYLNAADAQNYYPQMLSRTGEGEDRLFQIAPNLSSKKGKYANDYFTEAALNFLRFSQPADFNYYRGYFAYLPYTIPYASPEGSKPTAAGAEVPSEAPYNGNSTWLPAERIRAAMITRLDGYVGQLMDKLVELKNDKNTIIVFTSATGPQKDAEIDPKFFNSAGALRGFKGDLYEGGIRVPLIVRWPIQIRTNTTSSLPVAAWDLMPTVNEAARVPNPAGIDGISFLPTLESRAQTNRHEFLYWEQHDKGFKQAVRMGDWKAVRLSADAPLELYNLKSDSGEKKDVADSNQKVLGQIEDYLKTARTDDPNWPIEKASTSADADKSGK